MTEEKYRELVLRGLLLIMVMIAACFSKSLTLNTSFQKWSKEAGDALGGEFIVKIDEAKSYRGHWWKR